MGGHKHRVPIIEKDLAGECYDCENEVESPVTSTAENVAASTETLITHRKIGGAQGEPRRALPDLSDPAPLGARRPLPRCYISLTKE